MDEVFVLFRLLSNLVMGVRDEGSMACSSAEQTDSHNTRI